MNPEKKPNQRGIVKHEQIYNFLGYPAANSLLAGQPKYQCWLWIRFRQVLKGAVGTTLHQNEAELKISMEIDHQISFTDQTGEIRLTELIINDIYFLSYAHKFLKEFVGIW